MKRIILAATLLVAPAVAQAQQDRQQAAQIVLPNQEPRGEKTYRVGDEILRTPLRWTVAAQPERSIAVTIAGEPLVINIDQPLPLVAVQQQRGSGPFLEAYCTPRKSPPRSVGLGGLGLVGNALMQSWTDAQTCVVDRDRDGRFDHAMVLGTGGVEERVLHGIMPTAYRVHRDLPNSPDDEVRIRVTSVSAKQVRFDLQIIQRGDEQQFRSIRGDDGSVEYRDTRVRVDQGLPADVQIFGADFKVVAVDPARKTVTINWPEAAPRDSRRTIPNLIVYSPY